MKTKMQWMACRRYLVVPMETEMETIESMKRKTRKAVVCVLLLKGLAERGSGPNRAEEPEAMSQENRRWLKGSGPSRAREPEAMSKKKMRRRCEPWVVTTELDEVPHPL